ncbi:MAG TPA: LLM class flavin-dependent oxidoreductase [Caldilineaceae bacterium]|nr:LLM class flavin-dependent oxidoreductase [Caldilineaceae bacterium]
MANDGRPLRFGYLSAATAVDPADVLRLATLAETLGLDYAGIRAHAAGTAYEPWTLLTAIGMKTCRISLLTTAPDLSPHSLVHLARAAATLGSLIGGRVAVALAPNHAQQGGAQPSDTEAPAALEEAIQLLRLLWRGERSVRFTGRFYQLADVQPGPAPAHPIAIWLAGQEPSLAALAGRLADGWLINHSPALQPGTLARLSEQLDEAAASAGRAPSTIQRIYTIAGRIGEEERDTPFEGTTHQWSTSLTELAAQVGIDTFLLMGGDRLKGGADAEEQLRLYAQEVAPRIRELVGLGPGVAVASGLSRAYQGAGASGATPAEEETDNVDWVDETSMESFPASDPPASSSTA